jgi:hypothetical protein
LEMGSHKLFVQIGLKSWSSQSQSWVFWARVSWTICKDWPHTAALLDLCLLSS